MLLVRALPRDIRDISGNSIDRIAADHVSQNKTLHGWVGISEQDSAGQGQLRNRRDVGKSRPADYGHPARGRLTGQSESIGRVELLYCAGADYYACVLVFVIVWVVWGFFFFFRELGRPTTVDSRS